MKKEELMNKMSRAIKTTNFQLQKYSPEILVSVGIVGTIISGVMACKATTKIEEVLAKSKDTIDVIHKYMDDETVSEEDYSKKDGQKDLVIVYAKTGRDLIKLYGPSLIIGALSITSILASNNIMRKRNVALAAAYTAVDKGFKEYRKRVAERYGEEVEYQLRHNIKAATVEEQVTDENGKTKKVKTKIDVADGVESDYLRYFTKQNPYWDDSMDYNELFINSQRKYADDRLKVYGFITLNDVYKDLGFEETKAGMVVGWIYSPDNKYGDNEVRFDVHKVFLPVEGHEGKYEPAYAIDFNVDGNIFDMM